MKSFKEIKEEIANVSAGIGVRGFGDVSGTPKVGDEEGANPHIDRVVQGAVENSSDVSQFIKNNTEGLYTFDDDGWWEGKKGQKMGTSKSGKTSAKVKFVAEGMEKDHYKAIDDVHVNLDNRNHAIEDYGYGPMNPNLDSEDFWKEKAKLWKNTPEEAMQSRCGNCAAFNQSKEILDRIAENLGPAGKKITEMSGLGFCEMFHFKCAASRACDAWLVNGPIKEEIGGAEGAAAGTSVGTGFIAGTGYPREGKPSNWGEPGVSRKKQKDHKVLTRAKPNEVGSPLKEIPIQEVKKGMFAGEETFIVPSHVFEKAVYEKRRGQHWRTYIKDETFHPQIREFAHKNINSPIIFEDEKTGYMCYARYGKKRK